MRAFPGRRHQELEQEKIPVKTKRFLLENVEDLCKAMLRFRTSGNCFLGACVFSFAGFNRWYTLPLSTWRIHYLLKENVHYFVHYQVYDTYCTINLNE